jgi:hypothetical protein
LSAPPLVLAIVELEGGAVPCDRCHKRPASLTVAYPPPVDWTRLLCGECWEATKELDPLTLLPA